MHAWNHSVDRPERVEAARLFARSEPTRHSKSNFPRHLSACAEWNFQHGGKYNQRKNSMIAAFQVHKQTYGRWPAKNGKPAGESFDLDLIDMSLPAEHAYRGILPYRLSPDEKDKY